MDEDMSPSLLCEVFLRPSETRAWEVIRPVLGPVDMFWQLETISSRSIVMRLPYVLRSTYHGG